MERDKVQGDTDMPGVEYDVRHQIDRRLEGKHWILDPESSERNVFFERSVVDHLATTQKKKLGSKSPDYTFLIERHPVAVLEAKKKGVSIVGALDQAEDYAKRIGVDFVFACNGPTFKSRHVPTGNPLKLNGMEVDEILTPDILRKFRSENSADVVTVPQEVIESRHDLIEVFEKLNDTLREAGIRAGLSRFTEFANILFLKLLSEQKDSKIWKDLLTRSESELPNYINKIAISNMKKKYNSEVLTKTKINGGALKTIVNELNPLCLSSVEEDVKGAAFEHFLGQTTVSNNDLGEYFTPRKFVQFVVKLVNPQFGQTVYDPFCGTGGFLIQAFSHLAEQAGTSRRNTERLYNNSIYGQELTETARVAKMNMILFGDGHSGVSQGDSLAPKGQKKGQHDCILTNIPFSLKISQDKMNAVDPFAKDADEACLLHCFNMLKDGGSMGAVLPEGLVFNRTHGEMWNRIFEQSRVRVIASLPRGTFAPYTDAATCVLFLTDKGRSSTDWYYNATISGECDRAPGTIDVDEFLFFHQNTDEPLDAVPGVLVAKPQDGFMLPWISRGGGRRRFPCSKLPTSPMEASLRKKTRFPVPFPSSAEERDPSSALTTSRMPKAAA